MSLVPRKRQAGVKKKSITGDYATDSAFWRLSLVLKEIVESTIDRESSISDNPKPPSDRSSRKALKSKKEVDGDDNNR